MGLRLLQFRRLLDHFLDSSLHVERLFGQVVVLAFDNFAEALDGIGQRDVLALVAGELLGDEEGLGKELLDFTGAGDDELVLVGELVDAENGDDVLEILVALQGALDHLGHVVVVLADDQGVENAGGGSQRIDGGACSPAPKETPSISMVPVSSAFARLSAVQSGSTTALV